MPTLLPEGLGPEDHLFLALKLVHPFQLPVSLPEHCEYAMQQRVALGPNLDFTRESSINLVEALGHALQLENWPLQFCHWLVRPVVCPRNVALMRELSWLMNFPDRSFLVDYVLGMRTLGWADPAPRFIPRTMEPLYHMDTFWDDVDVHNQEILRRVKSSGDPKLDMASWEKTAAEFKDGALKGPYFSIKDVQAVFGLHICL